MDRGDSQSEMPAGDQGVDGVAAGASARVGDILAEAERLGRTVNDEAERAVAEVRAAAEKEVERIAAEAREAAREAARARATRLAELQAALTARGPAVVDGLEGAGITRARLEALIEAFTATAVRVVAEAEGGDPRDADESAADEEAEPAGAAEAEEPAAEPEEPAEQEDDDAVAAAEDLAEPLDGGSHAGGNGDGNGFNGEPARYDGPLPEGAPMARRPKRSRERDARFAALLLAVQGRERADVETHLRREHGFDDCEPILDEVFGRAPAY